MTYKRQLEKIAMRKDPSGYQYVFLIGAGASVSSGVPDGAQMIKTLMNIHNIQEDDIKKKMFGSSMTHYQAAMSCIQDRAGSGWISEFIRKLIRKARRPEPDGRWIINNCYDTLANILIEKPGFSRVVMTTNFDPLLYYAFIQNWNDEPILIRHPDEANTMLHGKIYDEFVPLLYLHGYWQNHFQYNDPSTLDDYLERWHGRLEEYHKKDVIVIGYSGIEDSIAIRWLTESLNKNWNRVWWCLYAPDGKLDYEQIQPIQKRLGGFVGDRLQFIAISSADDFVVDLGCELGLERAAQIRCLRQVMPWFRPSISSQFVNGAKLTTDFANGLLLKVETGGDEFPANNHAGFNIDTVVYEMDLTKHKAIVVEYEVIQTSNEKPEPKFEFKLHSRLNAWSYHIPIRNIGIQTEWISLAEFKKHHVDISRIWRIVLAADVGCLGTKSSAEIRFISTKLE